MCAVKKLPRDLSSFGLHLIAMGLMLLDHMWATVIPGQQWMTIAGRMAYPIFAFLIAEGFCRTRNLDQYIKRMFLWALLSEIPFNLMYGGSFLYPFGQNVLFTFWLSLLCLRSLKKQLDQPSLWKRWATGGLIVLGFYLLATVTFVDYHGQGLLTVVLFWLLRGSSPWHKLGQLAGLCYINFEMYRGLNLLIPLFGRTWEIPQQGFAVLALLFIWLYRGRQGPHSKNISRIFYAFYPVHMLILGLLAR